MSNQHQQKINSSEPDNKESQAPKVSINRISNIPQIANLDGKQTRFSPLRFLIITIGGIFLAEVVAMIVLIKFSAIPYYLQTLLDASIMVALIFPLIYLFSLRPLLIHIEKRKQAEDELRKSEERFVKAFHFSPAALSITRVVDGGFIDVNESFLRIFGSKSEDVIGHTSIELGMFINPDEREGLKQQTLNRRSLAQNGVRDYEMETRVWSGETRTVLISTEGIELAGESCILTSISDITERKRAEADVRRLSSIVEQTEDTVMVTDRNGVIEYVNPAFERLTGYTREEAVGKTPKVLKSGVHTNQFYKTLWDTILAGDVFQAEIANRKKNGESFYEIETITPLRDALGEITNFVATGKDITEHKRDEEKLRKAYDELELRVEERTEELRVTISMLEGEIAERKQAEDALRKAHDELELRVQERTAELAMKNSQLRSEIKEREEVERQLRIQTTAMEAAANGILITNHQGNIQWTNPAVTQMSGYNAHELIGQNTRVFKSGEHDVNFYDQMWNTILSGQVWQGEITNRRKDGSLYVEEQTITPVQDEDGQIVFFIAVKQDITEHKQVEAALETERLRLRNILDTMPDGVYIINQAFDVEYINPVIEREFGPIGGRKCFDYFHDQHEICPWCRNEEGLAGKKFAGEQRYARNNKIYELFDAPLVNSDGSVSKLKLLHDITERKQAELELEQRNVELQALTIAEHEQRQLAEALVGAAIILNRSLKLDEVLAHILEQIKEVIPYQLADIMLLEGKTFYDASHQGELRWPEALTGSKAHFRLDDFPLMKKMIGTGQPVLILNTHNEPNWISFKGLGWSRSFLSAPLLTDGQVIGFVNLFAKQPDFFTQKMSDRLVAFASHAAVAIQNAWLFEQVRASSERLHSLSRRLVEIQENERRYISRELHDEAGQLLTSLMVDLRLLEKKASQPEAVKKMITEMEGALNQVLENLHRVAMALRPASLDHVGLVAALTQHVESIGGKHGLKVSFSSGKLQKRLPANVETVLYRIVQEALTNVARHAHATRAEVVLTERDGKLILIIEDDGIGFDPNLTMSEDHLGLFGIRERAEMIDGKLVIESAPGKGTTIMVEVNYDNTITGRR